VKRQRLDSLTDEYVKMCGALDYLLMLMLMLMLNVNMLMNSFYPRANLIT